MVSANGLRSGFGRISVRNRPPFVRLTHWSSNSQSDKTEAITNSLLAVKRDKVGVPYTKHTPLIFKERLVFLPNKAFEQSCNRQIV